MTLSFGVAGLGRHGIRYARHLAAGDIPEARLAGVWTRSPDKLEAVAGELGAPAFSGLSELAAAVDAVVLAVPAGFHEPWSRAVAEQNTHLLIEKPLAANGAQASRLIDAFNERALKLSVAHTLRFDPLTRALAEAAKQFGPLTGFSFEQRLEPRGLPWEDEPDLAGGGVLRQTAIHTVDALRFVTQAEARVVWADTAQINYNNLEDAGWMQLELQTSENKVRGDVRVSKVGKSRHMRFCLYCEDGGLEADYLERRLYTTRLRDRSYVDVPEAPTVVGIASAFAEFLKGGPNPVPAEDALESLRLIDQAYQQAQRTGG